MPQAGSGARYPAALGGAPGGSPHWSRAAGSVRQRRRPLTDLLGAGGLYLGVVGRMAVVGIAREG
eukprot:scaffold11979_cov108-Isochrysis_galbana.AAC.1